MTKPFMRFVAKYGGFILQALGWIWLVACIHQSILLGVPLAGLGLGLVGLIPLYFGTKLYLDYYQIDDGELRELAGYAQRHPEVREFLLAEVARDPLLKGRTYSKAKIMARKLDKKRAKASRYNTTEQAREELVTALQK